MAMGIGISQADAQRRLAGFVKRKGWADIPAVKNKRVYGIYHTASRSLADLASAQFIAKTLYPQQFADIDPNKTYLDFYRKYLPVVPDGTFYIQLKIAAAKIIGSRPSEDSDGPEHAMPIKI